MKITPRRLRIGLTVGAIAGIVLAGIVAAVVLTRPAPAATASAPPVAVHTELTRIAPAPLLIVPLIDASGSMAQSDPKGLRYSTSNEMLAAVVGARPAPARTLVSPVYFGSRTVARRTRDISSSHGRAVSFSGWLGDTDFEAALRSALPQVRAFRHDAAGGSGRAIVVILTDGAPDLPIASSARALWPGIERAVAALRSSGAEIYLLGVSDNSSGWKQAAQHWRRLLGAKNVMLARKASDLGDLYRDLAATALDLGVVDGSEVAPGANASVIAGTYSESVVAQVTGLEAGATFRAALSDEESSTPVRLASRGERVTMRFPAALGTALTIRNTGSAPLLVRMTSETAVLRPSPSFAPCIGAPINGVIMSFLDGRSDPISSVASDPVAVSAAVTWLDADGTPRSLPLAVRPLGSGKYELMAKSDADWPAASCRVSVRTRSVAGEIGRQDYSVEPTPAVWASVVNPADMFGLADADSVPLRVALRSSSEAVGRSLASGAVPPSVSAEVLRPDGSVASASWLDAEGGARFSGILPSSIKDGIVRLTVIGSDGAIVSIRQIPFRMRQTPTQLAFTRVLNFAGGVLALLALVAVSATAWLLLKPPLAGSLIVKGGGPRPQRFTVAGQRLGFVEVNDTSGREQWLILPASRDAVRLLTFGLVPTQALIRRGVDHPYRGRTARLV